MSSSWGPSSLTSPDCMTAIMSALRIVDRRCAMTIVVRPIDARSRASCTTRSDSVSNALVASSRSRILGDFKIALAIAILCFCPPDIWIPRSPTYLRFWVDAGMPGLLENGLVERNYAEAVAPMIVPVPPPPPPPQAHKQAGVQEQDPCPLPVTRRLQIIASQH
uniref:Uncharacterized protein n=1 Tax=Leersia perrieri TaxID=77586 RepID=A0A0D9VD61_9ORYZ